MKSFFIFLAIIACVSCNANPLSLHEDLQDFLALIPLEKMGLVARKYLDNDEEFQAMVVYMQSPQCAELMSKITKNPKWIDFKEYDVEEFIKNIHDLISGAKTGNLYKRSRGLKGFLGEIRDLLPVDELHKLLLNKLNYSLGFQNLYNRLASDNSKGLFEDIISMYEVENIINVLKMLDLDVDGFIAKIYKFFLW